MLARLPIRGVEECGYAPWLEVAYTPPASLQRPICESITGFQTLLFVKVCCCHQVPHHQTVAVTRAWKPPLPDVVVASMKNVFICSPFRHTPSHIFVLLLFTVIYSQSLNCVPE
ncbi:hypothetical protein TRVL_00621 [Trypanosoma vivax]|nr:hypothetical protein TRVL_00621 [Trypanosoma vivax]